MNDFIEHIVMPIVFLVVSLSILAFMIYGCCFIFEKTNFVQERKRINQEWRQKVNDCVMNEYCRADCKLILYRDAQIHNRKVEQTQRTNVMTSAMVGSMIGGSMR